MDRDLGAAVPVPGLRPHDEPVAGLAASMAVVCRNGHHRRVVSAFDSGRDSALDQRQVRTPGRHAGMAESAALAGTVVGVADLVGLAEIAIGNKPARRESQTRAATSDTMAGRDADRIGIGGESSRRVGIGGEVEPERAGA